MYRIRLLRFFPIDRNVTEEQKEHESRVVTSWRSIVFHGPASFISSIVLFLSNDFWASNKTSLELLINLFYRPFSVNTNSPQRLAIFPLRPINKLGRISNLITRTVPGAAFYTRGSFYKVITRQFAARKVLFQLRVSIILDKTISTKGYVPALSTIITSEFIRDEICLTGTGEASYRRNNSSLGSWTAPWTLAWSGVAVTIIVAIATLSDP